MHQFVKHLPKIELHLHIEGTLEPALMFELAQRNNVDIPYQSIEDVKKAYDFHNLQSFLDIYYQGANVLIHEQDFYDLTWEYLLKCKKDNVLHTEIFFDPQTHTERGVHFDTVVHGIDKALRAAETQLGITSNLIMCFLKHLDEASAIETLKSATKHKDKIIGVGLDSTEIGNPMSKFERVFEQARQLGFKAVAHAGEEGPAQNIIDAIEILKVERIDHGVRCTDNNYLVEQLKKSQMALTVCPLSNIKLKVFENMTDHNIVELLRSDVKVTINSDDPSYFGGYMTDNFHAVIDAHELTHEELARFTLNAIEASFIEDDHKERLIKTTLDYLSLHQ